MTGAFLQNGSVIAVDAPEADFAWLNEFLEPAFDSAAAASGQVRVSFEADPSLPIETRGAGDRATFMLDSGPIRLPESALPDGLRLHDTERGVVFDVSSDRRDVRIRYCGSRLSARMRLMRVVREYAHNHAVRTGGMMLHAAAVTVGDAAVVIPGPKGTGKTTLALRLLGAPDVGYLSNDRVLVRLEDRPQSFAVPAVIGLRAGTRLLLPTIAARLQFCGDFREHVGERLDRGPSTPVMSGDRWHVSPRQLSRALGRSLHATAPLAALVFPTTDRAKGQPLCRLGHIEAAELLKQSLLCRRSGQYASEVFVTAAGSVPGEDELHSRCSTLVAGVACFKYERQDGEIDVSAVLRDCLGSGA